jgi:hypothetical protein
MGRGRAKAKQTKVARELKYSSGNTDLSALQAELAGSQYHPPAAAEVDDEDEDDDLYAKYVDDEDER